MPIQITSTQSSTLTDIVAPAAPPALQSPQVVICMLGDSNTVGGAGNLDTAGGTRFIIQRILAEHGVNFRFVGTTGHGALNGTGTTWGRFPNTDDHHDARKFVPRDWRHDGFSGRRISKTTLVTAINAGTATFTAPGNTLVVGAPVVHTVSSGGTLPTLSVAQNIYWCASVSGDTYTITDMPGGSAVTCSSAGSGTLTLNEGLLQLTPYVFAAHDVAATDIIIAGGTNDCVEAITTLGLSQADALALLQTRAKAYYAAIQAARPYARKYVISLLPFTTGVNNQASLQTLRNAFNAWAANYIPEVLAKQYNENVGGAVPVTGDRWTYVDAASLVNAANVSSDGVHPIQPGYQDFATGIGLAVVRGVGGGNPDERFPRVQPVTRPAQAWVELRATTDRITIATQASLAPGSDNFYFAIDYVPFETPSGTNVIVQAENPYNTGLMLVSSSANLLFYWKNAGTSIPASSYVAVIKRYRRHQLFVCGDLARQQAAAFLNGQLLQRVNVSAAAITPSSGWSIGGQGATLSAPGLYRRFLYGHSTSISIEDAPRMAQRLFELHERPPYLSAEYLINEGTGTTINGTLSGSTAGALSVTTGGWVTSGRYLVPGDEGYIQPAWDQQIRTIGATYTAAAGEFVRYDGSATGFTITIPAAINASGREILLKDVVGGTNTITIAPSSGTVAGGANITRAVSGAITKLTPNGTDWVVTQ